MSSNFGLLIFGFVSAMALVAPASAQTTCTDPGKPKNGMRQINSAGTLIHVSCNRGFRLRGSQYLMCKGQQWNASLPTCEVIPDYCVGFPPAKGHVPNFRTSPVATTVGLQCTPGYVRRGNATYTCSPVDATSGIWWGTGECKKIINYCDSYRPAFGLSKFGPSTVDETAALQCPPGSVVIGNATYTCTANTATSGFWSGSGVCKRQLYRCTKFDIFRPTDSNRMTFADAKQACLNENRILPPWVALQCVKDAVTAGFASIAHAWIDQKDARDTVFIVYRNAAGQGALSSMYTNRGITFVPLCAQRRIGS